MATAGGILAVALASFLGGSEFESSECPGPCSSSPVYQRTANPRMDVSVTPKLVIDAVSTRSTPSDSARDDQPDAPTKTVAVAKLEPVSITTPPPTTSAPPPVSSVPPVPTSTTAPAIDASGLQSLVAAPERCTVGVATEPTLRGPTATALAAINEVTPHLHFVVADVGLISIAHGGEWPTTQPPLGWTGPDRRTILINPDHPASLIEVALADVIVHEFGHVLISTSHVSDGTILDPQIDGIITIGQADRAYLADLTCADLGL